MLMLGLYPVASGALWSIRRLLIIPQQKLAIHIFGQLKKGYSVLDNAITGLLCSLRPEFTHLMHPGDIRGIGVQPTAHHAMPSPVVTANQQ